MHLEALTGFSLVSSQMASQLTLENGSHCGNDRQSTHSKDRGGAEEPLVARV